MADADAAVVEALVAGDAVVRDLQLDRVAVGDDAAAGVRAADGEAVDLQRPHRCGVVPDPVGRRTDEGSRRSPSAAERLLQHERSRRPPRWRRSAARCPSCRRSGRRSCWPAPSGRTAGPPAMPLLSTRSQAFLRHSAWRTGSRTHRCVDDRRRRCRSLGRARASRRWALFVQARVDQDRVAVTGAVVVDGRLDALEAAGGAHQDGARPRACWCCPSAASRRATSAARCRREPLPRCPTRWPALTLMVVAQFAGVTVTAVPPMKT